MKKALHFLLVCPLFVLAQHTSTVTTSTDEMAFVSDTQQPMWVEKILLKSNHNIAATAKIFVDILRTRPANLYMLGDVVSLGYRNKKWREVDRFLDSCKNLGIHTYGLLGNHEVMGRRKKGEVNFSKRFPLSVRTGYVSIADSVAVVLLNSNFSALSSTDLNKELSWYKDVLQALDKTDSINAIIVACHHAPYSNSRVVGSSGAVLRYFVPPYIQSKKARLFITGHAHAFEHFKEQGKDFVVIGGGGGLHQPLNASTDQLRDLAPFYKPMFHYITVKTANEGLWVTSHFLKDDFSGFGDGYSFIVPRWNQSPAAIQKDP